MTKFWPLERGHVVTSPFGPRWGAVHYGADFGFPGGSGGRPVFAVQSGRIIHAGAASGFGGPAPAGWLVVAGTNGVTHVYGHIVAEPGMTVGASVAAGQQIARINPDLATNGGSAPHLHLEQHKGAAWAANTALRVDPLPWLAGAQFPGETETRQIPDQQKRGEMATAPQFREIDKMGNSRSPRSQKPRYFLLHTEEGGSTAEGLANYCNNTANEVSYHYTLRNRILCDVVDTDYASWSVLDANTYTLNLCFAGSRAGWTRQQWLDNAGPDIEIAAWIARQDCLKYGIDQIVYGPNAYAALAKAREGISDHRFVTRGLGIGTHTDVGDGFPWDVFRAHLDRFNGTDQEDDMALTPDQDRMLREIWDQLRGPGGKGWPQLGGLTPVDAIAKILGKLDTLNGVLGKIASKLSI